MKKKDIKSEINDFLNVWDIDQLVSFLQDTIPLFQLYNVDEENDWVRDIVGKEDMSTIRLIRTVYLVSQIAEAHAGRLCLINAQFKHLWKRMEKCGVLE